MSSGCGVTKQDAIWKYTSLTAQFFYAPVPHFWLKQSTIFWKILPAKESRYRGSSGLDQAIIPNLRLDKNDFIWYAPLSHIEKRADIFDTARFL